MLEQSAQPTGHHQVHHLNPETLPQHPAFTQVVTVRGPVTTVYVGGQNAVDTTGSIIGKNDLAVQAEHVLHNLQAALAAGGARLDDVIKWNVYVVHGYDGTAGFAAFQRIWGNRPNPPTITLVYVAALAHPDMLMEMDAVAVVPHEHAVIS